MWSTTIEIYFFSSILKSFRQFFNSCLAILFISFYVLTILWNNSCNCLKWFEKIFHNSFLFLTILLLFFNISPFIYRYTHICTEYLSLFVIFKLFYFLLNFFNSCHSLSTIQFCVFFSLHQRYQRYHQPNCETKVGNKFPVLKG